MKALWKGYITLGRLGVPVRLYAATQHSGLRFVQLHAADGSPIERPLFCKHEHAAIPYSEVVRGVETEPGKYVQFTNRELERSRGASADAIEIQQFCSPSQIRPSFYEKPYYVAPTRGGEYGYALLRAGLLRTTMLALGRFHFYGNDYVCVIEAYEDSLMLHRLRFADALVPRSEFKSPPLPRPHPAEVDMLQSVIERHSGSVHMRDYRDEHGERLKILLERKAKGLPMPQPERVAAETTSEQTIPSVLAQMLG